MLISNNRIIRKRVSILLILALNVTGLFSCQKPCYADNAVLSEEICYHLDMGVQLAYNSGCDWGSDNIYGSSTPLSVNTTITFNSDIEVIDTHPLNSSKGSSFDFNGETTSHNIPDELGDALWAYNEYYANYVSISMTEGSCSSSEKDIDFNYTVRLNTQEPLEVVSYGEDDRAGDIYRLFGGKSALEEDQPEIAEAIEIALDTGKNGTAGTNKLYLIFCPNVIEYKKYITIGDLEAKLSLPSSVRQGESYTASDASLIDSSLTVDNAILEKHYGDGVWETAATWDGPGRPGRNTGGSVNESCDEIGTVTYRLTVTTTNDQVDTDTKTIRITDSRDVEGEAILELPAYTYEGHPALAEDVSVFTVDGVNYSARRAYEEDVAKNKFIPLPTASGAAHRESLTTANVIFPRRGDYNVRLEVNTISGSTLIDTKPITVRKTPYIIDNLSGFQKQNRKQILNIAVATYPGKPITDYAIAIKDKKTGNTITLTANNPQENNGTIKTRAVKKTESNDGCYTYFTVEFLTKTPSYNSADPDYAQDFYYEINVEDIKGDTDTASKTFAVTPDIPPTAAISLDSAFLRQEGSNTAKIITEDITIAADGDSVERTWYYAPGTTPSSFASVASMDGYQKLSFGTDKIVGFHKTGVGKFTTTLFVKEKWTEPTLEEYVTDSEHLTGTSIAYSDVQNVAPIVSLEVVDGTEQEILLIANNDSEFQTLMNNKTALQQALLADKIDGQIVIKKLTGGTPANITGITAMPSFKYPYGYNQASKQVAADSEKVYILTHSWNGAGITATATVPYTVHAVNPFGGEVWSYTTNRSESFNFGQDDTGKYLYLIYSGSNQTVMLDKRTGAVAGTIQTALSDKVYLSGDLAFEVENGTLYAINMNTLNKTVIAEGAEAVSRVGGNLQYITKTRSALVRCTLDMETFEAKRDIILNFLPDESSPMDYEAICIDSTGKIVLWKHAGVGTDPFRGVVIISAEKQVLRKISIPFRVGSPYDMKFALDEEGKCNYMIEREQEHSGTDTFSTIGINLSTGNTSIESSSSANFALISCGAAFESKGVAHFLFGGDYTWYSNGQLTWSNPYYDFSFDGTSGRYSVMGPGNLGSVDQIQITSDRFAASIDADNSPINPYMNLKILAFPRSLTQETKELIARFTDKLTFLGSLNTTADQIKAAAEAPKPTMKIAAAQNGYLALYNLTLEENKTYYYDYEIKPLNENTDSKLTGLSAVTPSMQSNQPFLSDTFFVEKTYYEDFNDSNTNKFFTLGVGLCPGYGGFGADQDVGNSSASLTFTVPPGKRAILNFDILVKIIDNPGYGTGIFINGTRAYVDYVPDEQTTDGHYTHYKILSEGLNIIQINNAGGNGQILIDNLKVEILSSTKPSLTSNFNTEEGDRQEWIKVEGNFETPNGNISYGAQASSHTVGMIPYEINKTYKNRNPQKASYTQTVPAGYIQKGWAYPTATTYENRSGAHFTIAGYSYEMLYRAQISPGDAVTLLTRTEGTYGHSSQGDSNAYYCFIPTWELITYPSNAVTITDNIAFNDDYTRYFFPKETSTQNTTLSIYLPKGEYLIKDLRLYYIENGRKIYLQNEDCEELTDLSDWNLSTGLTASMITEEAIKTDDEYIKIYKKGEKVLYNIFYSDYEEDPSKTHYWVYQHINWPPDGIHPDAGKVLNQPIDRFYLGGKYTVTHWQMDNTQRTGTVGDASSYNKESNKVDVTFYVDGGGAAPWVTYIKTEPKAIKENSTYTLAVGVDDAEKDVLSLETEVYLNGKRILTHKRENLWANANGVYPETLIEGLPTAKAGVYQAICTVSDYSGTGIKSYKFTVVSEGKITGFVNHTDQWDENRKKYNLKRFSEEVNRPLQLSDYLALITPRTRGTNVFWSGEKFMLRSEAEGGPWKVDVQIQSVSAQGNRKSTGYSTELSNTGRKTASGAELWEGSLWDKGMINKWGRKTPEQLIFIFTAYYAGGMTKTNEVIIIVDSWLDYWQLHRLW